jgi:hypothetical protein
MQGNLLLYVHRHRSIWVPSSDSVVVMGQIIRSLSSPGFELATFRSLAQRTKQAVCLHSHCEVSQRPLLSGWSAKLHHGYFSIRLDCFILYQ